MNDHPLVLFWRLSRPLFLLAGALFYALGAGIAKYLGYSIDPSLYWLGQLSVSSLQLATHYLNEYFDFQGDRENQNRTRFSGGSGVLGEGKGKIADYVALLAAASSLTVFALSIFWLQRAGVLDSLSITLLALAFFGAFFYSVPPFRLVTSGFGELTASFLLANLVPAMALILQSGELHRLIAMSTFPLTALSMAAILAFEFPDYASDLRAKKETLLVRVDWEKGIQMHGLFVMAAYLLMALSYAFGLPIGIALAPLLTLPIGGLQIWLFGQIADGAKPNWNNLTLLAVVNVVAVAYLYAYAFWTR
jgi:1,4-dihydroxy-2-naphthoate octaprenyltransferase